MKKIIALLLLLTIGISSFSMPTFALEDDRQWRLGDAPHNFDISITAATEIQKYLAGLSIPSTNEEPQGCVCCVCADVNEDGTIDIKDVTEIQKYLADIDTGARCGAVMENYLNTTIPLSEEEELTIKDAFKKAFEGTNEIILTCYAELSDNSKLIFAYYKYSSFPDVDASTIIKNYLYIYPSGRDVCLYINDRYCTISEAYNSNMISDELLDEIAEKLHFFLINTNSKLK